MIIQFDRKSNKYALRKRTETGKFWLIGYYDTFDIANERRELEEMNLKYNSASMKSGNLRESNHSKKWFEEESKRQRAELPKLYQKGEKQRG